MLLRGSQPHLAVPQAAPRRPGQREVRRLKAGLRLVAPRSSSEGPSPPPPGAWSPSRLRPPPPSPPAPTVRVLTPCPRGQQRAPPSSGGLSPGEAPRSQSPRSQSPHTFPFTFPRTPPPPPRERACGRLRPQTQKFRRDRRSACPQSRSWSPAADGDPPTAGTGAGAPQPQTDRDAGRGLHVGSVVLCWARGAGAGPRPDWGACPPTSSVGPASSAMSQRWGGVGGGCPNSSFSRVPGPRWQSGET